MSRPPPDSAGAVPTRPSADGLWQPTEGLLHRPGTARGNALPAGHHLAEFELLRVLGEGGFGIVYLAHDHSLQRRVAIKEYMPTSLAMRSPGQQQVAVADRHRAVFAAGLDSFIDEARLLAQFDHPSLLKVYRVWRENGTAYMVMPYYEGQTLKQRLQEAGMPPDERWLRALLASLTEALAVVHAGRCLHRDIAPDNVLLLAGSGRPLLLDFGAARQVIGDATQALTAILKPGYAPVEQYAEMSALKQGPWTDVYALCAVVHAAITGHKPPPSVGRTVVDQCQPLARAAAGRYSADFLQAIDAGLQVLPQDRPQSVQALRRLLGLDAGSGAAAEPPARPPGSATAPHDGIPMATPAPRSLAALATPAASTRNASPVRGIAVAGALLALVAGVFWAGQQLQAPASPAAAPASIATAAAAPVMAAADATRSRAAQGAPDTAAAPAQDRVAAPAAAVLSIDGEFQRLLQARSDGFDVRAGPDAPRLRIGRDRLGFRVSAARDGHVYVLVGGPDGSLQLLFPNRMATDNRIRAAQTLVLPQPDWPLDTAEPAGTERFAVIVSEHPRDFSHLGRAHVAWFLDLPTGAAGAALAQAHAGPGSAFAGRARCDGAGCDRYGAALFSVDVVR